MDLQPNINVGTLGSVSHGKTTLVRRITNSSTMRSKKEIQHNMTIKLGYANAKLFYCDWCNEYESHPSETTIAVCQGCGKTLVLRKHVSFVDCPGHKSYMSNMLNGMAVMNAAVLVIAANDTIPQSQTLEHIQAIKVMEMTPDNLIVCLNKIDLIEKSRACEQYLATRKLLQKELGFIPDIIPISAQYNVGVNGIFDFICGLHNPDTSDAPLSMIITRSFDINKPGCEIQDLQGGVVGGTITQGSLNIGDIVKIYPGIQLASGEYLTITSKVISIQSEKNKLTHATCGELVGINLDIDPTLTKDDRLVGNTLISDEQNINTGKLVDTLTITYHPLNKKSSLRKIKSLVAYVGANRVTGNIVSQQKNICINMQKKVYVYPNQKITIVAKGTRDDKPRIYGWGIIASPIK